MKPEDAAVNSSERGHQSVTAADVCAFVSEHRIQLVTIPFAPFWWEQDPRAKTTYG
jgi:hypothetical protein